MKRTAKLWLPLIVLFASLLAAPGRSSAQAGDSGLPDAPSQAMLLKHRNDPGFDREVSWRSLPKDFLHDQKEIWLFPTQLARGRFWFPTLAIAGGTAGLVVADPHIMPYFRSHANNL